MEAQEVLRWVAGVGFGLLSALVVAANLYVLVRRVRGNTDAPSYIPIFGFVFGTLALVVIPIRPHSLVLGCVLLVLALSESAGVVHR